MAQLTKVAFLSKQASLFADNTSRDITEQDLRDFRQDISDSFLTISDNFIDEDSFASNSDTKAPSQQSVKVYVDNAVNNNNLVATVSLSSAQILALNTTPIQLVAAPGANKMIVVSVVAFYYDHNTTAYATNTTLHLRYASAASSGITLGNFITQTQDVIATQTGNLFTSAPNAFINQALNITVDTGNPTAGDGTLVVKVYYRIVDFS